MRVKHFIVTYKNPDLLHRCIRSIVEATPSSFDVDLSITVINNHSEFHLDEAYLDRVRVLHNDARPDFSKGHLSRSWNQCLLHGFVSLAEPDADVVICSQNDNEFTPSYLDAVIDLHERFDLVTYGSGDNCVSYTPRAVRRVGLWDERFCNIGWQEADYFLRARKYLGDRASLNDEPHGRLMNMIDADRVIRQNTNGCWRHDPIHWESIPYHEQSRHVWHLKWGKDNWDHWTDKVDEKVELIDSYILYPYFEKDIETLAEQRYQYVPVG